MDAGNLTRRQNQTTKRKLQHGHNCRPSIELGCWEAIKRLESRSLCVDRGRRGARQRQRTQATEGTNSSHERHARRERRTEQKKTTIAQEPNGLRRSCRRGNPQKHSIYTQRASLHTQGVQHPRFESLVLLRLGSRECSSVSRADRACCCYWDLGDKLDRTRCRGCR